MNLDISPSKTTTTTTTTTSQPCKNYSQQDQTSIHEANGQPQTNHNNNTPEIRRVTFADGYCPGDMFCGEQEVFWDEPPPPLEERRGVLGIFSDQSNKLVTAFQSMIRQSRGDLRLGADLPLAANRHDCECQKKASDEETVASVSSNAEAAMGYVEFDAGDGSQQEKDGHMEAQSIPWTAYLMLACTVVGLSAVGPLLSFQEEGGVTFKILWRSTAFALSLIPFVVVNILDEGLPSLSWECIGHLITAGVCYGALSNLFSWSLCYTTVGNAVIFGNTQSLILVLGGVLMGQKISLVESLGVFVAFLGAVLSSRDSVHRQDDNNDQEETGGTYEALFGNVLALGAASAGVGYLLAARKCRPHMSIFVFMFCIMVVTAMTTLCCIYATGEELSWDRDMYHGVFGWTQFRKNRLPLEVVMVLSCSFIGSIGLVRCMKYFSDVAISTAILLNPSIASIMAVFLGVGVWPGWMGWFGNTLVLVGTFAVVSHN